MKRTWLLGLILLSVLMAGCSFGGPSASKQPPAGTYDDLAVTVYREDATALTPLWQKLFPKAYAEDGERRGIRVAVSHRDPYVQVSRDVKATGDVFSVSMRVPAWFGYRLSALEYVEVWGPSGKFFKVLSWGSQYPVDVDALTQEGPPASASGALTKPVSTRSLRSTTIRLKVATTSREASACRPTSSWAAFTLWP